MTPHAATLPPSPLRATPQPPAPRRDTFALHRGGVVLSTAVALLLTGCLHRPDPDALARAAPAPDVALQAAAERVVLDTTAFDAARQRTPAPPRAEPPPPAAKPTPAPIAKRLSVSFGSGGTRLSADQAAALQQLGKGADRGLRWRVTTRIDAVGAPTNNRRLARARADRVVDQLVRAGVERGAISVVEVQATAADAGNPQQARRVDVETVEG